jgi:hypothetical protein
LPIMALILEEVLAEFYLLLFDWIPMRDCRSPSFTAWSTISHGSNCCFKKHPDRSAMPQRRCQPPRPRSLGLRLVVPPSFLTLVNMFGEFYG